MDPIKNINDLSETALDHRAPDYYHSHNTRFGNFWCSGKTIAQQTHFETQLPAGIHIGAGIASMTTMSPSSGHQNFDGALASYFIQPEGFEEQSTTTLKVGRTISSGLFLPWHQCDNVPEEVSLLSEKFDDMPGFRGSNNIAISVVEKLCAPIGSHYEGDALKLIAEARVFELLASVMIAFTVPLAVFTPKTKLAYMARDYIEANLMEPMTLQTIAKEVGSNVRSLTQAFRQHFNMSINQYMTHRRLEKALNLLEQGLSVSQTAYLVGYSLPYFSEKFQQRFGVSASSVSKKLSLSS